MPISSRAYAGVADLERMLAWSVAANRAHQQQQYLHVGDLVWRLYQNTVFDPAQHLRLWEDEQGELLGFAWHEEPDGIVMQIHPRLRGQGLLEPALIAWGAGLVDTNAPSYDGHLWTRIPDSDHALTEQVTTAGFIRDEGYASKMQRDLSSAFRGQGIAKAVILEGLRRMLAHGATSAYVTAIGGNVAAEKLYASAGFQTPTREYQYRKPLV